MTNLSIIIVSYNTREILKQCLDSLVAASIRIPYEVIVIDNASSDGSAQMVKDNFKKIIVIENKENVGFSKANNIGIKKSKGDYVLFLNSDTKVFKDTIEVITTFMDENQKAGAATCEVKLLNGAIDDASHRGFPTPWNSLAHFSGISKLLGKTKLFGGYTLSWMDLSQIHEIDACAGAFMMVRRQAGDEIGWWDEDYFWYGDDLDFCYRLKQKGWSVYYVPTVSILHYKGVSGGLKKISKDITTANSETKKKASQARFDAMRVFYNKHYKNKYPSLVTHLVFSGIKLKQLLS